MHKCVSKLNHLWLRKIRKWYVACSVPSHHLNQWWFVVNWTHMQEQISVKFELKKYNKFHWRGLTLNCRLQNRNHFFGLNLFITNRRLPPEHSHPHTHRGTLLMELNIELFPYPCQFRMSYNQCRCHRQYHSSTVIGERTSDRPHIIKMLWTHENSFPICGETTSEFVA